MIEITCLCHGQADPLPVLPNYDLVIRLELPRSHSAQPDHASAAAILSRPPRPLRDYLAEGILNGGHGNTFLGLGAQIWLHIVESIWAAQTTHVERVLVVGDSLTLALLARQVDPTTKRGYHNVIDHGAQFRLVNLGN